MLTDPISSGIRKLRSAYPCPCAWVRMLIGISSTEIARSVPWSRLKPRRKYWLALPSPLCWVTIRPGTTSRASPGLENGRALTSVPPMFFSLDEATGAAADTPTAFESGAALTTGEGCRTAVRLDRPPRSAPVLGRGTISRRGGGARQPPQPEAWSMSRPGRKHSILPLVNTPARSRPSRAENDASHHPRSNDRDE
jgi:hypothetical protein